MQFEGPKNNIYQLLHKVLCASGIQKAEDVLVPFFNRRRFAAIFEYAACIEYNFIPWCVASKGKCDIGIDAVSQDGATAMQAKWYNGTLHAKGLGTFAMAAHSLGYKNLVLVVAPETTVAKSIRGIYHIQALVLPADKLLAHIRTALSFGGAFTRLPTHGSPLSSSPIPVIESYIDKTERKATNPTHVSPTITNSTQTSPLEKTPLWPHQEEAINASWCFIQKNACPRATDNIFYCKMACGTGKTRVFLEVIRKCISTIVQKRVHNVCIIVTNTSLLAQLSDIIHAIPEFTSHFCIKTIGGGLTSQNNMGGGQSGNFVPHLSSSQPPTIVIDESNETYDMCIMPYIDPEKPTSAANAFTSTSTERNATSNDKPILTLCTWQSTHKLFDTHFDLVILDEGHHQEPLFRLVNSRQEDIPEPSSSSSSNLTIINTSSNGPHNADSPSADANTTTSSSPDITVIANHPHIINTSSNDPHNSDSHSADANTTTQPRLVLSKRIRQLGAACYLLYSASMDSAMCDYVYDMRQAINDGILCNYVVTIPIYQENANLQVRVSSLCKWIYQTQCSNPETSTPPYKLLNNARHIMIYCSRYATGALLHDTLTSLVTNSASNKEQTLTYQLFFVHQTLNLSQRKEILQTFASKHSNVCNILISMYTIGEGIDIPNTDCVILFDTPTSLTMLQQRLGRMLRRAEHQLTTSGTNTGKIMDIDTENKIQRENSHSSFSSTSPTPKVGLLVIPVTDEKRRQKLCRLLTRLDSGISREESSERLLLNGEYVSTPLL